MGRERGKGIGIRRTIISLEMREGEREKKKKERKLAKEAGWPREGYWIERRGEKERREIRDRKRS